MADHRENGIHLIVVQSEDGSLVVGDSHHYSATPDPFIDKTVNDLILGEMETILDLGPYDISETWIGTYASAPDRWRFTDAPDDSTRIVVVTPAAVPPPPSPSARKPLPISMREETR